MDPGSMNAMMEVTGGSQTFFQARGGQGAGSFAFQGPNAQSVTWVKLVRTGSIFTGYESTDGQNWTLVGSTFISMPTDVYVGLAVTAHNNSLVTTATFDQVAVTTQTVWGNVAIDGGGGAAGSFLADQDFSNLNGGTYGVGNAIDTSGVTNPAPQAVYQTERWGAMTYTIPHLMPGQTYEVRLHFAEIFWSSPGQRVFNVDINGQQVLTNFDILATTGAADKAVVQQFQAQANSKGQIIVQFILGPVDNPKISGIETFLANGLGSQLAATGLAIQATAGHAGAAVPVASFTDTASVTSGSFAASILWGDGTSSPGVVVANGQGGFNVMGIPTYAQAGNYTVTVRILDKLDHFNVVVLGTANVAPRPTIAVFVGYYDDEHANPTLPNPWNGSPNVTFFGGTTDGFYDAGAIRIVNLSSHPEVIDPGFYVNGFANGASFQLWDSFLSGGFILGPGHTLILTQTGGRDFDTSDQPIIANPADRTANVPVAHFTVNGRLVAYVDQGQVLNTGGFDPGNAFGSSESIPWQQIGSVGWAP
jgi:hypothetical protein